jgi:hypothetical protein
VGEYEFYALMLLLPALLIIAGVAVLWLIVQRGYRQAEFRHRERMAMIERGMTPPDPVLGDRALQHAHGFKMTLGILMCGLGLALFMLISFAASAPGTGFGIGGAFVMLGLTFMASAFNTKRDAEASAPPPRQP